MNKILQNNGVNLAGIFNVALAAGSLAYLKHRSGRTQAVFATEDVRLRDCTESSNLRLKQVQVIFRHGARTPIHTFPRISQANFDEEFILKEHQASLFPYEAVSCATGKAVCKSSYQKNLDKVPLKGGAMPGDLTSYGKDEMYKLGKRLRESYRDQLNLQCYDCRSVHLLSTNIRRTLESARCVMAGIFGSDHLREYASRCGPILFFIDNPKYNILIPSTRHCEVLNKVNHAAMTHPDFIPIMKEDRLKVEGFLEELRELDISRIEEAQKKIERLCETYQTETPKSTNEFNEYRQQYSHDPVMYPLLKERTRAIENVPQFWSDVLCRHPVLSKILTEDDMLALKYLKRLEIEDIKGKFQSGHRYLFYFEKNPYFHNDLLCKEVYTGVLEGEHLSWSTEVKWKPQGRKLIPEKTELESIEDKQSTGEQTCDTVMEKKAEDECVEEMTLNPCESKKKCAKTPSNKKPRKTVPKPKLESMSFFAWFTEPVSEEDNLIGDCLRQDIWSNPLTFYKCDLTEETHAHKKMHFVFANDDMVARTTHGWEYPASLKVFKNMIYENATRILFYAMTGQHEAERKVVTQLASGPLLSHMINTAERQIKCGDAPKLCLYSSHDSTLTALMEGLGIWQFQWPPFGSDIRIELYEEEKSRDYYVRVLFNGQVQKVRGCKEELVHWCDLKKSLGPYTIKQDEYCSICASDVLEKLAACLLKHEEGEEGVKDSGPKAKKENPAGM